MDDWRRSGSVEDDALAFGSDQTDGSLEGVQLHRFFVGERVECELLSPLVGQTERVGKLVWLKLERLAGSAVERR